MAGFLTSLAGLGGTVVPDIVKARTWASDAKDARIEYGRGPGKGVVADPHVWVFAGGQFVEKPYAVSYTVLRYLCQRDNLLAAIILTRLRQVRSFAQIRTHEETERSVGKGFRIRLKQDASKSRTRAVIKREDELNQVLMRCCRDDCPSEERQERNFAFFLMRFVRDRLVLDQACAELVLDGKGQLVQFYAIDGATIRLVDPASSDFSNGKYAQVYQQRVVARFSDEELAFCPENVTTELIKVGYGTSEVEWALRAIVTHLGIDASNERMFHPGGLRPSA
jgi:hypothetical protein